MKVVLTVISENASQLGRDATCVFTQAGGTIGRSASSQWRLPDPTNTLSSRHATISFDGHGFVITDTSMNGVYINTVDEPVGRGNSAVLKTHDLLYMSDYVVSVDIVEEAEEQRSRMGVGPMGMTVAQQPLPAPTQPLPQFTQPSSPQYFTVAPTPAFAPPPPAISPSPLPPLQMDALAAPTIIGGQAQTPVAPTVSRDPIAEMPAPPSGPPAPPPAGRMLIPEDVFADLLADSPLARQAASSGDKSQPDLLANGLLAPVMPLAASVPPLPAPSLRAAPIQTGSAILPADFSLTGPDDSEAIKPPLPTLPPGSLGSDAAPLVAPAQPQPRLPISAALSADLVELGTGERGETSGRQTLDPVAILRQRATSRGSGSDLDQPARNAEIPQSYRPMAMPRDNAAISLPPFNAPADGADWSASSESQAFFDGLGIDMAAIPPERRMDVLIESGKALRHAIEGLVSILGARKLLKGEFQIDQTTLQAQQNNPLKFAQSVKDVLQSTVVNRPPGFLSLSSSVEDAFRDLQAHEMATIVAMQATLKTLVDTFDPLNIEGGGGKMFGRGPDKARQWDQFVELHATVARSIDDINQSKVGAEFARIYTQEIDHLSRATP